MAPGHFILDEVVPCPLTARTGTCYTVATPEQQTLLRLDCVTNGCHTHAPDLTGPYVGPRRQLTPAERKSRRLKRKAGNKARRLNRQR